MTHERLLRELGDGEIAYWRATFELEHQRYNDMRERAEKEANAKAAERQWRVPRSS